MTYLIRNCDKSHSLSYVDVELKDMNSRLNIFVTRKALER